MKGYILAIAGAILISAVISIIAPNGKMGKFVKGISRLFIFVVLITPFVRFAKDPENFLPTAQVGTDEDYLRTYTEMLARSDEKELSAFLEEKYGIKTEISVSRSFDDFSYEKITVLVTDFGINENQTHIDIMSAIEESIETKYACKAEVTTR